jgi:seryl-tRNA synthetase
LALLQIPNLPADDVKSGKDEGDNEVVRKWSPSPMAPEDRGGEPAQFDFKPKDHLDIGESLGILDVKHASKVSGSRFAYLKGDAVLLEFALVRFALEKLTQRGFIPIIPPVLIKKEAMQGMGYFEHGGMDDMYILDQDSLVLVGTSEQSIGPMYRDETFNAKDLPLRYAGFSTCFRREAGSYGKDTKGILRVHQFDKVEMFSFTRPEDGDKEHNLLLKIEEELMQALGIPYRVVKMCSGDLGAPAARKFDLEAWMPGQGKYREVTSTSTTTDFQSRRLNIRYKDGNESKYVHMLNGTAFAIGRTIIAILENYQQKDGTVRVPKVLKDYLGKDLLTPGVD